MKNINIQEPDLKELNKGRDIEEKMDSRKRVSREWLDAHGFLPLEKVRKQIEGSIYGKIK